MRDLLLARLDEFVDTYAIAFGAGGVFAWLIWFIVT
jgi:hypothetical protein